MAQLHEIVGMSSVMLDIICSLRYHQDTSVKRSLLFALSRIILIDSKNAATTTANQYHGRSSVYEILNWLQIMMKEDGDSICREQAKILVNSGWL
jgi:hypothetical protein